MLLCKTKLENLVIVTESTGIKTPSILFVFVDLTCGVTVKVKSTKIFQGLIDGLIDYFYDSMEVFMCSKNVFCN